MKSVIFDLDGTLVDSQPLQFFSYRTAFAEIDLDLSWTDWKKYWVNSSINAYEWAIIKGIDFDVEALRQRKRVIYENLIKSELKVKPGAIELVDDLLENGFKLGIASSSSIESIEFIADLLFKNKFSILQSDTLLDNRKPHPEIFTLTMKRLGSLPSETVIIEDSVSGYNAAVDSGAISIICPDSRIMPKYEFLRANKLVYSLHDLNVVDILDLLSK